MRILTVLAIALTLGTVSRSRAQGAPDIVWEAPTPSGLGNHIDAVAWPAAGGSLAVGSSDRWLRSRRASDGGLIYSVLEPHRSGGVARLLFSTDGALTGVQNQNNTMGFRVERTADGVFLGSMVGSVGQNGLVSFVPDATLQANTGGDGTLSRWRFSELTVSRTTGSGYSKVTTTFNFSADGALQTAASRDVITVQRRSDGSIVRMLSGGSVLAFSPDSSILAAWSANPNEIVLFSTSTWSVLRSLKTPQRADGVVAVRFTRDGLRLVATGYLPYVDAAGLWQQTGTIRFWRVSDGVLLRTYDQHTDLGVTSPVAWSPDGTRYVYGTYNGMAAVARTPP